jgi:HSP20 family protein
MSSLIPRNEQRYMWDPFQLFREFYMGAMFPRGEGGMFTPDFEVKEREKDYVIQADVPGVNEEDLDITMSGSCLTIAGKREASEKTEDERYVTYERRYGAFSRSFTLPSDASTDDIDARLDDGVLTIVVPKSPASQPRKVSLKERVKRALKA